jgi:hypothetical protein
MLVCDRVMNNDVYAVYSRPTEGLDLPALEVEQVSQPVDHHHHHSNSNTV